VVSDSTQHRRPVLTLDDLARPITRRPERLHALTTADLSVAFSQALDLAEGKPLGHAKRVCYIATSIADAMDLDPSERAGVYYGALLHDVGVTPASADLCRVAGVDESAIFGPSPLAGRDEHRAELVFADKTAITDALHQHTMLGAEIVRALELPDEAAEAVAYHHERWDGCGFPNEAKRDGIPAAARIIAVADAADALIGEQVNALVARRHFASSIAPMAGAQLDPAAVTCLLELSKSDPFWLGLNAEDLSETLQVMRGPVDARRSRKRVLRFAEVFADLADAKRAHAPGHARRTADGAERIAESMGLDSGHVEMIRLAALLCDLGLLGVPARVMSKPDILTVTEMQLMRQHPGNAEAVLQDLPGFEEVALWIARHHERPDGKGYPEMLAGDEIPLESRIIAVSDMYAALTADRPHRGAMPPRDARKVMLGAAGTQLDPEIVRTFCALN
jgi:putative nucleotidyltransferase with HDIG domain